MCASGWTLSKFSKRDKKEKGKIMSWEWSHTTEAYENAYNNVHKLDVDTLATILAEWGERDRCRDPDYSEEFGLAYFEDLDAYTNLPQDTLADEVWKRASEHATCTNGGFQAHLCPYGCGCHMVSFDSE